MKEKKPKTRPKGVVLEVERRIANTLYFDIVKDTGVDYITLTVRRARDMQAWTVLNINCYGQAERGSNLPESLGLHLDEEGRIDV